MLVADETAALVEETGPETARVATTVATMRHVFVEVRARLFLLMYRLLYVDSRRWVDPALGTC